MACHYNQSKTDFNVKHCHKEDMYVHTLATYALSHPLQEAKRPLVWLVLRFVRTWEARMTYVLPLMIILFCHLRNCSLGLILLRSDSFTFFYSSFCLVEFFSTTIFLAFLYFAFLRLYTGYGYGCDDNIWQVYTTQIGSKILFILLTFNC